MVGELTKVKLAMANSFVAIPGLILGAPQISLSMIVIFTVQTQLMAMASQAANQLLEVEYDRLMKRTKGRPLPSRKLYCQDAFILSTLLWGSSNILCWMYFPMANLVLQNTIFGSYLLLYTPMKRFTAGNTLIGALIGALPPLLGWTAAGSSLLTAEPLSMFVFMLAWQISHFYGILWMYADDYKAAGFQMMASSTIASIQMSLGLLLAFFSTFWISWSLNPGYSIQFLALCLLAKWGAIPIYQFSRNPVKITARRLMMTSYGYFSAFWLAVWINALWKRYSDKANGKGEDKTKEDLCSAE